MNISVVGLGKLGAPLAAVLAHKGHTVIGVDVNQRFIDAINDAKPPVFEPGLGEMIAANRARLTATGDFKKAVHATDITFVVVPTPSDASGAFSLQYVLAAAQSIGDALRDKNAYHLVVITSTVMPGSVQSQVLPVLEKNSGKKLNAGFGLCYNPEFIALGSVIRDTMNPDFILIGESDARAGEMLQSVHQHITESNPKIARMNFVNAELTKLAVNTFVTTKISYANMLSQVCERLPGANIDAVTSALGMDSRIGKKYLKGAVGFGGPCFPRDNIAFATLARQLGARATLAEATDVLNQQQSAHLADIVKERLAKTPGIGASGGKAAILGLSYKPETDVVERSPGLDLAKRLIDQNVPVVLHDPVANANAQKVMPAGTVFAATLTEACKQADVIVIMVPWPQYKQLSAADLKPGVKPTLIDCWRFLGASHLGAAASYVAIGVGPEK